MICNNAINSGIVHGRPLQVSLSIAEFQPYEKANNGCCADAVEVLISFSVECHAGLRGLSAIEVIVYEYDWHV